MAPISFPRPIPAELTIVALSFRLAPQVEVTPIRSGKQIAADLGPSLWTGDWRSPALPEDEFGAVRAWLDSLSNTGTFLGYDRLRDYPLAYKDSGWEGLTVDALPFDGTCILDDVAANNVEIDLVALPAAFVLTPGDYLAFDYGAGDAARALHRIVAGGTASAGGALTVEVRPEIRIGWEGDSDGRVVDLYRPACHMIVLPGSVAEQVDADGFGTVSFQAVQTL